MKKKEVFRKDDTIHLNRRRYVNKVGYDYDIVTVMQIVYRECFKSVLPEVEVPTDLYSKKKSRKNAVSTIWNRHPDFAELREGAKVLDTAVRKFKWASAPNPTQINEDNWFDWVEDEPPRAQNIYSNFVYQMVREYLFTRLKAMISEGNERKLYFQDIPEEVEEDLWVVHEKKCVQTGMYFAPYEYRDYYGEDCDYSPGGLRDSKTHILLRCSPHEHLYGRTALLFHSCFSVLVLNGKPVKTDYLVGRHHSCWLLEADCERVVVDKVSRAVADRLKVS